jgi:hypothetical protein
MGVEEQVQIFRCEVIADLADEPRRRAAIL